MKLLACLSFLLTVCGPAWGTVVIYRGVESYRSGIQLNHFSPYNGVYLLVELETGKYQEVFYGPLHPPNYPAGSYLYCYQIREQRLGTLAVLDGTATQPAQTFLGWTREIVTQNTRSQELLSLAGPGQATVIGSNTVILARTLTGRASNIVRDLTEPAGSGGLNPSSSNVSAGEFFTYTYALAGGFTKQANGAGETLDQAVLRIRNYFLRINYTDYDLF